MDLNYLISLIEFFKYVFQFGSIFMDKFKKKYFKKSGFQFLYLLRAAYFRNLQRLYLKNLIFFLKNFFNFLKGDFNRSRKYVYTT